MIDPKPRGDDVVPSALRLFRLGLVALTLLGCTACLEHFEALWTRVVYDPFDQTFDVERRLINVEARFLGCYEVDDCVAAIERAVTVAPDPGYSMALSDRLLQRLVESGAEGMRIALERDGDRLDVILRYRAKVGTPAADDTFVRAEWNGRDGRGAYSLVVSAQDSMEPPEKYRTRKVARTGAGEVDWVEEWILPRSQREVRTEIDIDEADPIFAAIPGLAEALDARGWLGELTALPEEIVREPFYARLLPHKKTASSDADDERGAPPTAVVVAPSEGSAIVGDADPSSPAKAWVYEARVSGGGVTPAAAAVALEPLVPSISRCYQNRQKDVPDLEGSLFLSALVRADGNVLATSVNGSMGDASLVRCLDKVLGDWRFEPWGAGTDVSDVAVPVVFKVEGKD